nr:AMP-dependent synthetase ligase domain containing protein [Haemonchus contortus]
MILSSPIILDIPQETLPATILRRCLEFHAEDPNRKAFIPSEDERNPISFKQLYDYSMALSSWFIENGFQKGDIILLYMTNCWQFVACCLGAWSAGLIVSPASSSFTEYELQYQLEDSGAKMVITRGALLSRTKAACKNHGAVKIACTTADDNDVLDLMKIFTTPRSTPQAPVRIDMERDLVCLPYSSGTSGVPKGVMISHKNYAMMLSAFVRKQDDDYKSLGFEKYDPPTHALAHLPFYHVMGLFGMLVALYHGTTQIIMDKFDLKILLRNIQNYKLTTVAVVPAMALMIADSPLLDDYDLSSLKIIACGAAPLGTAIVDRLLERLPGIIFRQGYGMTELSVASHIGSLDTPEGSVGKLMPGTKMKVVAEDGRLCGPYENGEIETYDSDGFMRTGDIVYYDKDGFTFICDRQKELIKVNGKQVSPSEIESVLLAIPGITDCCVIGVPDKKFGEIPMAYVVSKVVTEEQISAFVNERLAPYKRLRGGVKFVDEIPRTSTGKLLRRELKDRHLKSMEVRYRSRI